MESESLLEKEARQQSISRFSLMKEFKEACEEMWNTHVRSDLILNKKLLLCKMCISFFYQSDSQADHPREHVLLVQKYCLDNGITSSIILEEVLLREAKLNSRLNGKVPLLPSFNPIHKKDLKEEQGSYSELELKWYKESVLTGEKELEEVKKENSKLQQENKVLMEQLDILTEKYFKGKAIRDEERMKIEILITNLSQVYSRSRDSVI
jgi:hypothetical protein